MSHEPECTDLWEIGDYLHHARPNDDKKCDYCTAFRETYQRGITDSRDCILGLLTYNTIVSTLLTSDNPVDVQEGEFVLHRIRQTFDSLEPPEGDKHGEEEGNHRGADGNIVAP